VLKPEQAEKELKTFKLADGKARRLTRLATLPEGTRAIGYGLVECGADGSTVKGDKAREKLRESSLRALEELTPAERTAIFEALCPQLGGPLEGAWTFLEYRPYAHGWERQAFRAPGNRAAVRTYRQHCITRLLENLRGYEQDVTWLAAWAPHLFRWGTQHTVPVLAAALDAGGDTATEVREILMASARGEHPVGIMGRHVTGALLGASQPEGWEFIERMLLAAQREEGLRQVILESIDEAHPVAFRRMVGLILEKDLLRFSATLRAVDVWFGFQLEVVDAKLARSVLEQVHRLLDDPSARAAALNGADPRAAYLALCCMAFEDAPATVDPARRLLSEGAPELRYAAAQLLAQLGLHEARAALVPALDDPELRVALVAFSGLSSLETSYDDEGEPVPQETLPELFEAFTRLVQRAPKKEKVVSDLIWPGQELLCDQATVAGELLDTLGTRSPAELIPFIPLMEPYTRSRAVERLAKAKGGAAKAAIRDTLLALAGDAAQGVREEALKALSKGRLDPGEAPKLEKLLTRKAADLRRGVLTVLLAQQDEQALASAQRLSAAKSAEQRVAGLELLGQLAQKERAVTECRALAAAYRVAHPSPSESEEKLLEPFSDTAQTAAPAEDATLGLFDRTQLTPAVRPPEVPGIVLESPAGSAILKSLDKLIRTHRETPVHLRYAVDEDDEDDEGAEPDRADTQLLGDIRWGFPDPQANVEREKDLSRLPLREVWQAWEAARPDDLRDPDGLELFRALYTIKSTARGDLKHSSLVESVLEWLASARPTPGAVPFLIGAAETVYARVPEETILKRAKSRNFWEAAAWRSDVKREPWISLARDYRSLFPTEWSDEDHQRWWGLVHWLDLPAPRIPRERPGLEELLIAWRTGAASEADLIDQLLGAASDDDDDDDDYGYGSGRGELGGLTGRKPSPLFERYPGLEEIVHRCRARILDVELKRGDLPTPATSSALSLQSAGGMEALLRLLSALGTGNLIRGWIYSDQSKAAVFSKLIRATFPTAQDTPEAFAEHARKTRISEKRLVEAATYAPQWAAHVEHTLDWPQLADAIWWIHAHTKDDQWSVDEDIRESWTAQVSERTPLSAQALIDGAVDVDWFHRVHRALGPQRWATLDAAARFASGGGGHKRAQLFASAMLGSAKREVLLSQVKEKRTQDPLRALGLLPLPDDPADREREVLERYGVIQEFLRGSRQFGSMRQASEKLAASIAMENLARTAGYADPVRLEWAMEARAIEDLASGPVTATAGEVSATLSINDWGQPELVFAKSGKVLKSLPAAAKKDPTVAALVTRKREVERQASRMRLSLESAMCRGDRFTGVELETLTAHPVLAPMLRNLLFVRERDGSPAGAGYPVDGGQFLEAHDGSRTPVEPADPLRVAHPHDLLQTGEWHLWQRDCFRRERVQPFKQVFRELYVLTAAEQQGGVRSVRYAGHQVQNRRAMALLGKRGWVSNFEEGDVRRTFHAEGLTAWLGFDAGITTPAEVEGLTVDHVGFTRRGDWKPLPLTEVPARIFSEVMRDVDLVVSVAHAGGVDPEATQSSVEMRAALLRETCALLRIENVRLQETHALIDGHLSTYSVHLGSAVVHRQPGGHLCIVPVHSQHHGRLFLPFADNDPKTAEVVSKVILLARDHEIKDPSILEQIYSR
jgi:hypothetical protein